jgi:hypothetical protein
MDTASGNNEYVFSPFWPLTFLSAAVLVILVWNLVGAVRQQLAGLRLRDQQSVVAVQAAQAEQRMQAMLTELVTLSKANDAAETVVRKYGISINAPAGAAPAP